MFFAAMSHAFLTKKPGEKQVRPPVFLLYAMCLNIAI